MTDPEQTDVFLCEDGRTVMVFSDHDVDGEELIFALPLEDGVDPASLGIEPV